MICKTRLGLSLLELVTVIAILAVLAGIVLPQLSGVSTQSTDTVTKYGMQQVREAISNRYAVDMTGFVFFNSSNAPMVDGLGQSYNKGLPVPHPELASNTRNPYIPQLAYLFVSPVTNSPYSLAGTSTGTLGWRGPYLSNGPGRFPAATTVMANGHTATENGFYSSGGTPLYGISTDSTVLDGWGNPIVMQVTSSPVAPFTVSPPDASGAVLATMSYAVLVSAGADGVLNTNDDVLLKLN